MSAPEYFELDRDGMRMFNLHKDEPQQLLNLPIRIDCGMTAVHPVSWRSIISPETTARDALLQLSRIQLDTYRRAEAYATDYMEKVKEKFGVPKGCDSIRI